MATRITDLFEPYVASSVSIEGMETTTDILSAYAAASQAISLKRIADALSGAGPSILTTPINSYGESIGSAIQGQMIRGQNGISEYEQ
jgi:hypothetical protein